MSPLPPAPAGAIALKLCSCGAMLHVTADMDQASYPCSICGQPITLREEAPPWTESPPS